MVRAETGLASSDREPRPAELGLVDGLDLHAEYHLGRTGGDFFDVVRVGSRVAFLFSDIAGRRRETGPIAAAPQDVFRARAAELFGASNANLMEGTEMLVQAINLAIMGTAKAIHFAPTMVGCYDVRLGVLAYINAGGQTAVLRDSDGTRILPNASMPLGLFTHVMFDASIQAIEPGATLLLVTKGVSQSMRGAISFGAEPLMEMLRSSNNESASEVCRAALRAAHRFEKRRWDWFAFWRTRVP